MTPTPTRWPGTDDLAPAAAGPVAGGPGFLVRARHRRGRAVRARVAGRGGHAGGGQRVLPAARRAPRGAGPGRGADHRPGPVGGTRPVPAAGGSRGDAVPSCVRPAGPGRGDRASLPARGRDGPFPGAGRAAAHRRGTGPAAASRGRLVPPDVGCRAAPAAARIPRRPPVGDRDLLPAAARGEFGVARGPLGRAVAVPLRQPAVLAARRGGGGGTLR